MIGWHQPQKYLKQGATIMSEANKSISRDYIEGAWNRKDVNAVDRYIDVKHKAHGPFTDELPQGIEGEKAFTSSFITAFPDVRAIIERQEVNGDKVTTYVTFTGTHSGELMGIPATGKKTKVPVKITDRIVNGKIVETWSEWDPDDLMRQLGVQR